MKKEVLLWGGTGQAIVLKPIIEHYGSKVAAIIDDTPGLRSPFHDVKLYHGKKGFYDFIKNKDASSLGFVVAIGNDKTCSHQIARVSLSEFLIEKGLSPETVIHPTAYVEKDVELGKGTQIMAGARIITRSKLEDYCIVNTGASLDHESRLGKGVEVSPCAVLCGCISLGEYSWVGANATVLPRVKVAPYAVVGAGSVVTKNVNSGVIVAGNPARAIKYNDFYGGKK